MKELDSKNNKDNDSRFDEFSLSKDYKGKTILITGHTGFKGAWLTIWLYTLGSNIVGYSLESDTQPNLFESTKLESKITHIIGDIRNEDHISEVIQQYQPEMIFHLAAQSLVQTSYKEPKMTYETNIIGTVNLLEAVRKNSSVRTVINVTSDKCYENKEWTWGYREIDPMGGFDPYSSSKACSELITSAYRRSFFNPKNTSNRNAAISSVRAGNVIGGGDWALNRVIPDCIKSLVAKDKIKIRNPLSIRPWQYVLEPLSGYLWLGILLYHKGMEYASAWNFGPNETRMVTVKELVERVIQIWGEGSWITQSSPDLESYESKFLKLDCSKAHHFLKWFSLYNLEEALFRTINWYKQFYLNNTDSYELCLKEIQDYTLRAKKKKIVWSY